MSTLKGNEFQQALAELTRRTAIDPEFRALALKDSRAAFAKVTSAELAKDIKIQFVDNSGPNKIVPLPDLVAGISGKDIEAELENVAGGTWSAGGAFTSGAPVPKPSPKPLAP